MEKISLKTPKYCSKHVETRFVAGIFDFLLKKLKKLEKNGKFRKIRQETEKKMIFIFLEGRGQLITR